jgi:hypothetical protein|tara:strand:- start:1067 stop:1945 length:879 start_codon:yes stop_codon:yes gene_type:complete
MYHHYAPCDLIRSAYGNHPFFDDLLFRYLTLCTSSMTRDGHYQQILDQLEPLRSRLIHHPVYQQIHNLDCLRVFMQHHIFAVWDFMSLLKALQQQLTCVSLPWTPPENTYHARMINEIVLAEECDENSTGGFSSHFDLYHNAMKHCGADTGPIDYFVESIRDGNSLEQAFRSSRPPNAVVPFIHTTFEIINRHDLCSIAAMFTFGRENLLPDLFSQIVKEINAQEKGQLRDFQYYLERHIELDGDHHQHMAIALMNSLCDDDPQKWQTARKTAVRALEARLSLWNDVSCLFP